MKRLQLMGWIPQSCTGQVHEPEELLEVILVSAGETLAREDIAKSLIPIELLSLIHILGPLTPSDSEGDEQRNLRFIPVRKEPCVALSPGIVPGLDLSQYLNLLPHNRQTKLQQKVWRECSVQKKTVLLLKSCLQETNVDSPGNLPRSKKLIELLKSALSAFAARNKEAKTAQHDLFKFIQTLVVKEAGIPKSPVSSPASAYGAAVP
ncbi:hypothetical protein BTVI_79282 [Pitangus sulphuratus]|nr:hypothetical protein BTVI_79282 [Pitangus sulphuratus]